MRLRSAAFLKCLLLTAKPVCNGAAATSVNIHNTLKGKLEKDLPSLNNCSMALRLLSFSSFLKVYRCFVSNYSKLVISHASGTNKNVPRQIGGLNFIWTELPFREIRQSYFLSPCSLETVRLWRPFFLRLANTLRPLAVCMRWRNPWTDFLRRLCGW